MMDYSDVYYPVSIFAALAFGYWRGSKDEKICKDGSDDLRAERDSYQTAWENLKIAHRRLERKLFKMKAEQCQK